MAYCKEIGDYVFPAFCRKCEIARNHGCDFQQRVIQKSRHLVSMKVNLPDNRYVPFKQPPVAKVG